MNKNNLQTVIEKLEGKLSLSDRFHNRTKNKNVTTSLPTKVPDSWIKIHYKTYPRLKKIDLKQEPWNSSYARILLNRKSYRRFSGTSITLRKIAKLLFFSAGIVHPGKTLDEARRSYPSAGARYPSELYLISFNIGNLADGLYHYDVKNHNLEKLVNQDLTRWILSATGNETFLKKAAAVFIITGVLDRTRIKYRDRGYRFVLIEAGHLAQNLILTATALNLGSCPIGGFIDDEFDKLLDIDKRKEVTLYLVAIGGKQR